MERTLVKKTVSSAAWTYLSYVMRSLSVLITTVVLTRLITQEEFGIVGFAITAMAFFNAIRDFGIGQALVQRRTDIPVASDTAFWIGLSSNVLMWLAAVAISPAVATFFNEPQILTVMPIISLTFVINGLGTTHDALLQREMDFHLRAIPEVLSSVVKGIVSVILALMGLDVWALVFGLIAGRITFTVSIWWVQPWRPKFRFNWPIGRQMLGYGSKISLDSLINALQDNIDYVFIGRLLGEAALGMYTVAFRIPELVIKSFSQVLAHVLFPAYASISEDMDQIRASTLSILRYLSILLLPAGLGLAVVAPLATRALFSEEWYNVGPVMGALAVYSMLLAVSWNIGDVYKAIDRADILWKTAVVEFIILAPVLFFAAQVDVLAVAIGHAVVAFVVTSIRLIIASSILKLPMRRILAQLIPSAVSVGVMIPVVLVVMALTETWLPLLSLALSVIAGGIVYGVVLWRFERDMLEEVYWFAHRKLTRRKSKVTDEDAAEAEDLLDVALEQAE